MKKFFGILTMFSLLIAVSFAAAPTDRAVDANVYLWPGADYYQLLTPSKRTCTGVGDTSTLAYRWQPKQYGADVIFVRGKLRGTTADSVGNKLFVECLDNSYNLLYTVAVDTFTDSLGEAIKLPIGTTAVGNYYNIKLITITGHRAGADSLASYMYLFYPKMKVLNGAQ
jgi:hypothetical protein